MDCYKSIPLVLYDTVLNSVLQPGWVNLDIWDKWVTFSLGQAQKSGFIILSNIAVTNNTSDCSIREY